MPNPIRIVLRFRPDLGLPLGEHFWADDLGTGHARLLNCSFFVPLCVGDIVELAADVDESCPVVTGVATKGPNVLSLVAVDPVHDAEVERVANGWRRLGASWSEGAPGLISTVWSEAMSADDVFEILVNDLRQRPGWHTPGVYAAEERTTELLKHWCLLDPS